MRRTDQLIFFCRAGFERDCAEELEERARAAGITGTAVGEPGGGLVALPLSAAAGAERVEGVLAPRGLVFARHGFRAEVGLDAAVLTAERAVPAVLTALEHMPAAVQLSAVWVEAPDTEAGKRSWPRCRALAGQLTRALEAADRICPGRPRLHLLLAAPGRILIGRSDPPSTSLWPMGIPRLKMPRAAPSRSTLKLEEAFLLFLPPGEREGRLRPGMCAVDLGAAPGGWSWQLARRGLRVSAVDNGALAGAVLGTGLVDHVRADAFTFRPPRRVDWMVCDLVAPPARVAKLVGTWGARAWCGEAVFNLKLPGARRYREVLRAQGIIERELGRAGQRWSLRFKQLYHDRGEVTGHLRLLHARVGVTRRGEPTAKRRQRRDRKPRA